MNIAGIIATPDKIPAGDSNVLPPNLITFGRNGEFILEFQNINAIQITITVNTVVLYHGLKFLFPFLNMNVFLPTFVNMPVLNQNGCGQQTVLYEDPLERQ